MTRVLQKSADESGNSSFRRKYKKVLTEDDPDDGGKRSAPGQNFIKSEG